jgi:YVTN family beta-propeller protein
VTSLGVDTGTVFVIDTATNNVTAVVPVGGWPAGAAVNPAGTKVYVATPGFNTTVSIIDTATNTVDTAVDVGGSYLGELRSTRRDQEFM